MCCFAGAAGVRVMGALLARIAYPLFAGAACCISGSSAAGAVHCCCPLLNVLQGGREGERERERKRKRKRKRERMSVCVCLCEEYTCVVW